MSVNKGEEIEMQKSRNFLITVFIVAVVGIFVLGGERGTGRNLLLDNLEGELNHQTVDYGSDAASSIDVSGAADVKICGKQSLKLAYDLDAAGYMFCARGFGLDALEANKWSKEPSKINWNRYQGFSFMMFGQKNGKVAFDVKDSGGEMWRIILDDDVEGWKEVVIPFSALTAREDWQPESAARNKILDFPIKSYQWEPRAPGKGVLYFDCVKLVRKVEAAN
jgi:hypothetical protein